MTKTTKSLLHIYLLLLWLVGLFLPIHSVQAADQQEIFTFEQLSYGDRTAIGMFGSLEYYFPVPQDQVVTAAQMDLIISHSHLLRSNRSTLTVFVNDIAVSSVRLDDENIERAKLSFALPTDIFQDSPQRASGYTIRLQFYMRLTDLICEEGTNPALWATVHKESTLSLQTTPRSSSADLALWPYPLLVAGQNDPQQLTFHIQPQADEEAYQAALTMAAAFGRQTRGLQPVFAASHDPITTTGRQIAIGYQQTDAPATLRLESTSQRTVLFLDGSSPSLLARQLADPEQRALLRGETAQLVSAPDPSLLPQTWAWQREAATFAQLGASDRTLQGVGQQSATFYFTHPKGWELTTEKIYLDLHVTFSPLLHRNQSGIRVRINGLDVGGFSFEQVGPEAFYRIPLPADVLTVTHGPRYTHELTVEIIATQYLAQNACEPVYSENAWTTIHADSYFYLPHASLPLPDASLFPYPFVQANEVTPMTFVLPPSPTDGEIAAALELAHLIGQVSYDPLPEFQVRFADSQATPLQGHLILIGTPERNPLVAAAEAKRPQEERGLVTAALTPGVHANIKEFPSPWDRGHYLLIISGEEEALVLAARALSHPLPSGSIFAIGKDGEAAVVKRLVPPPGLPQPLRQTRSPLIPPPQTWQVIIGVSLLTLFATVIAVLLYRRAVRGKSKE